MHFQHSAVVWRDFPHLVPVAIAADGISTDADVDAYLDRFATAAKERLAVSSEGELPEIQAWRRAFSTLGLKPTQYRCAAESLLRRFRKDGALPRLHPLVDLCNAASLAFAVPIAVFDAAAITDYVEVRYATGTETYETFAGDLEHPYQGEIVFADAAGRAHARRWTNRQSGQSAVHDGTGRVLVVAEALHADAPVDLPRLRDVLTEAIAASWSTSPRAALLDSASPRFDF